MFVMSKGNKEIITQILTFMKTISYISGTNNLMIDGEIVEFNNWKDRQKAARKLEKQGYQFPDTNVSMDIDEFDGLCQANQLGINPFEHTILG